MNINRHNYETIFLMYIDNELSDAEKTEVLVFLQRNPDLLEEFKLLQNTILKPASIVFYDKDSLIKKEISAEIQESLLLLLDDEITTDEKEKLTGLIAADAALSKEWNLLQQTKLSADSAVIFDNKNSLYRTSRERVIGFDWLKVLVAAILIGFGIWFTVSFFIKKDSTLNITVSNSNNIPAVKTITLKSSVNKKNINEPVLKDTSDIKLEQQTLAQRRVETDKQSILRQNNINSVVKNNLPVNNLSQTYFTTDSNKTATSNVSLKKLDDEVVSLKNDTVSSREKLNSNTVAANIYASNVSLKDNADETNNDNHILYIPEEKLQKTSIGGFFSKVKKAIKNKASAGIRIANVEIAIK